MPKPHYLQRPSGLYVRFHVPRDLRGVVGSRFIVRSLKGRRGDEARLAAALIGMALSRVFDGMRRGGSVVDIKKLLDSSSGQAASRRKRSVEAQGPVRGAGAISECLVEG